MSDDNIIDPVEAKDEVDQIIDESREVFVDLVDAIKNRPMRTIKLDLGFDEVSSEKLLVVEDALGKLRVILDRASRNSSGIDLFQAAAADLETKLAHDDGSDPEQTKLWEAEFAEAVEEVESRQALAAAMAPLEEKVAEMEEQATEARKQVAAESLSVELRAIPYGIARGAARRARKTLGITQKGVPEDMQDEFEEEQLMELAYDQVVRWRDNRTGKEGTKLTLEELRTFRDYLPLSQSSKFFNTVNDLQFKNAISESAIAQADF